MARTARRARAKAKKALQSLWVHSNVCRKIYFGGRQLPSGSTTERGTYIRPHRVRTIVAEATGLGIPEEVMRHAHLLRVNGKPDRIGFWRVEKLIVEVWEAKAAGQDPAPQ